VVGLGGGGFEIFLHSTACYKTGTDCSISGVKHLGRESNHSPLSSAEVKNSGAITLFHLTSSWRGAPLLKHGEKFIFYFFNDVRHNSANGFTNF
jgi:hypothetical protein